MVPIPWQIGLLGVLLALAAGFVLGLSLGVVLSAALRRRRRYVLDGMTGAWGFLAGVWLSAESRYFAVEVNGVIVGWQPGIRWPHLRAWAFEHGFFVSLTGCLACVVLGRVLAGTAGRLKALRSINGGSESSTASP